MFIQLRRAALVLGALLSFGIPAFSQTWYGISNGFGIAQDNQIYQIDVTNGNISNSVTVTLPGFTLNNSLSLAAHPTTGVLYAIIQTTADATQNRRLVTINPVTGVATTIGQTGRAFSSIAFRSNGVMYGVTGDGATTNPETLFTISVTDATSSLQFALGNGLDGETIAFHGNGLMYHSSGNATAVFESVNVDTQAVTGIGSATTEMFAMGYDPINNILLGSDINNDLFSINIATGARTFIDNMAADLPNDNRGLAFVAAVPEPSTMVLCGGALVGAWIMHRRRKAARFGKL